MLLMDHKQSRSLSVTQVSNRGTYQEVGSWPRTGAVYELEASEGCEIMHVLFSQVSW